MEEAGTQLQVVNQNQRILEIQLSSKYSLCFPEADMRLLTPLFAKKLQAGGKYCCPRCAFTALAKHAKPTLKYMEGEIVPC